MCGYAEQVQQKTHHAVMNHYVSKDAKGVVKEIVVNRNEETFEGKDAKGAPNGITWTRKDIADKAPATKTPVTPTPPK